MIIKNPNCDNDKCVRTDGEIRVLPTGGDSNALLCQTCHAHELRYRRERNRKLADAAKFDLPSWDQLEVYEAG